MSRAIKFQFLYKGDHQFHRKVYYLDRLLNTPLYKLSDVHHQMKLVAYRQFIGLTLGDTDVYEGDIISYVEELDGEFQCGQKEHFMPVVWCPDYLQWRVDSGGTWGVCAFDEFSGLKVVGNIYENTELLGAP